MYRCYSCKSPIKWYVGLNSSPASPIRCKVCDFEQNRPGDKISTFIFSTIGALILVYIAFIISILTNPNSLIIIAIIAFIGCFFSIMQDIRKGVLVPSNPKHKLRDRIILIGFVLVALAVISSDWL
jgi:hypothetical protein